PPINLTDVRPEPKSARAMYTRALLVSLTNPKTLFFYGAFFPQFVVTSHDLGTQIGILTATFLALAVLVDGCWALGGARVRGLLGARVRPCNRISGGILVGDIIGLSFARKT